MDGSKGRAEKYSSEMTEQFGSGEEEEHMKNSSQSIDENGNSSHIAFSSIT